MSGYGVVGLIMETYGAMAPEFRTLVEALVGDAMRNTVDSGRGQQLQIHTFAFLLLLSIVVMVHRLFSCFNLCPSRTIFVVLVPVLFLRNRSWGTLASYIGKDDLFLCSLV